MSSKSPTDEQLADGGGPPRSLSRRSAMLGLGGLAALGAGGVARAAGDVVRAAAAPEEVLEPDLTIIDPHFHIVDDLGPKFEYSLADHLRDTADGHKIVATVHVETTGQYRKTGPEHLRSLGDVDFAYMLHEQTRGKPTWAAKGIVGFVDLTKGALTAEGLDAGIAAGRGALRGIRHDATWDESGALWTRYKASGPDLYSRADFRAGLTELTKRGLSFDTWQYYYQLPSLAKLATDFPNTPIVVNHTGGVVGIGPYAGRREEIFKAWRDHVRELARRPNVWMKLGGLGMEISGFDFPTRPVPPSSTELAAAWGPYFETCIEAFGPARCMYESNFPIDRPSTPHRTLWNAFKRVSAGASADEKARLFYGSANSFYRLDKVV